MGNRLRAAHEPPPYEGGLTKTKPEPSLTNRPPAKTLAGRRPERSRGT